MDRVTVKRSGGIERFLKAIDAAPELTDAVNEAANAVRNNARRLIRGRVHGGPIYGGKKSPHPASQPGESPADQTDELARKIRVRRAKPGDPRKVAYVLGGSRKAHLEEFGTVTQAPRPFLGPAMEQARAQNFKNIKQAAWRLLQQAADKAKP